MGKKKYIRVVEKMIDHADIILEILDARYVEESRNKRLEDLILKKGKKLIFVINKSDLVPNYKLKNIKADLDPCVFVSSKSYAGYDLLKQKILKIQKHKDLNQL
jgi:hypothetical protein